MQPKAIRLAGRWGEALASQPFARVGKVMDAYEVDVRSHEHQQASRQNQGMHRVEASEGKARNVAPAQNETGDVVAHARILVGNVCAYHCGPVGLHIPRQQIACEAQAERHQKQADAREPGDLPGSGIGAVHVGHHQVAEHEQNHQARAPVMQAAHYVAEWDFVADILYRIPCLIRRWHIVEGQNHAGHHEQHEG